MDVAIIGGGIVGLATALELKRARPDFGVRVLEKEPRVGAHQSSHNSGVLHSGLYYKPGSIKAQLTVSGIRRMVEFCQQHGVRHEICGKVVVACDEGEVERLRNLQDRGQRNGLKGLQWLSPSELREIEPHAAGLAALRVPEEGIVDFGAVCAAMNAELSRLGGEVVTSARVTRMRAEAGGWTVETTAGDWKAGYVINCAGLHSDRVAGLAGAHGDTQIVPFRGEYYRLKPSAEGLVKNLIYPVPDPQYPFLGVHFTRMIGGGVEAGPSAVLAFAREGYTKWQINGADLAETAIFPGLWRFMRTHRRMVWDEIRRSFSRRRFCEALQRLVPEIREGDIEQGEAGVRAQAMQSDGTLVQDFSFLEGEHVLHVLNAPSPGATASLSIGNYLVEKVLGNTSG